jgi:site-specific recombinase XerD
VPRIAATPTRPPTSLDALANDYLESCRERGLAPTTIRTAYAYTLVNVFLPWCARHDVAVIEQLTQKVLDQFTADLLETPSKRGKQLSPHTVHHYVRVVRQFLKWCRVEDGTAAGKPQLPELPQRALEVLSRDDIDRLELAAPTERDKLIIRLLADTGIRVGELCSLEPTNIITGPDQRAFLKILGEGPRNRLVPIAPKLAQRLESYQRFRPTDARGNNIFLAARRDASGAYASLTTSGVLQLLRGAADRAGLTRRVHPHLLRHSFAAEALRRGMNPVQLAHLLGHSGLRMIEQVYAQLTADDGFEAVMRVFTVEK